MRITCLAVLKQGWLGVPLFFLGIATLAFSQLADNSDGEPLSPQEMNSKIARMLDEQKKSLAGLSQQSALDRLSQKQKSIRENLSQVSQNLGEGSPGIARINANLLAVEDAWRARLSEIAKGLSITEGRLLESEKIFIDLKENFAGRIDEAQPALEVLLENLGRSANESNALAQLLESASQDLRSGLNTLAADSDDLLASAVPTAPVQAKPAPVPSTQTGRGVVAAIQSNEAVPLSTADRFGPTIESSVAQVGQEPGSDEMIQRLQIELAASKSVQTELSADTTDLQGDLRKAYREIVSLQANLKESQMVVEELERTRKSLWRTEDGSAATAQTVSKQINRLEYEVQQAKDDLRQSRQSLLMEQERSNSMIRSISTELERTRRELDFARTAAMNSGADSTRLLALERELAQSKRALQMAQTAPQDASSESYLNLQNELRKALGEMARMQVELGEKDELEEQLLKLRSSLEEVGDSPSRSASPAYVNKLLIDLNAAKKEVAKARAQNSERRGELSETVIALEEELEATKFELDKTQKEFEETKKSIATRELEFATTIQALEEEAQLAQDALREASLGKLPAIPFVEEMEENLANSEARMKSLSDRFDTEQDRASEIIQGLQTELESALIRQKRSMDQLARKQLELEEKDTEVQTLAAEKKRLNEELEVVKVIAGQLQDLNSILEDTKQTQSAQTGNMDEVLTSLKDELNQAKVELVFALEEKDVVQEKSSEKIRSLEMQLEDTRTKLLEEQENLVISTSESKDLLLELKSELDAAREEIARMKTAGLGESVETRQAVSQLQEALGNIRILQQNLEEAEQSNQDVDELRVDLAEAMSTQLNELQKAEDEKKALGQTIDDLETEIAMLREEGKGNSLTTNQALVELQEELKVSQTEVSALEARLAQAEDSGLSTLVVLEDELAEAKMKNQELEKELQNQAKGKSKTVELLEKELTNAMLKLDQIESSQSDDDLAALMQENQRLASQLNDNEQSDLESISAMESELSKTLEELRRIESRNVKMADEYAALQSQLQSLEDGYSLPPSDSTEKIEIAKLRELIRVLEGEKKTNEAEIYALRDELQKKTDPKSVSSMNPAENNLESQLVLELQGKLEGALGQLAAMEKANSPKEVVPDVSGEAMSQLEEELANAELTIMNLQKNIEQESSKRQEILTELKGTNEKLLEIEKSNNEPTPILPNLPQPGGFEQIEALENELMAARDLINELTEKNLSEENARNELENRLADAMGKLDGVESSINRSVESSSDGDIASLRNALDEKEIVVRQLKEQLSQAIEELSQKEAELELAKEIDQIVPPNDASADQEILALQNEIGDLRKLLEQAKQEAKLGSEGQVGMNALQMQLQDAVAESLEMQAELEETKQRLVQVESEVSQPSPNEKYANVLQEAKIAESTALKRIDQLTAALRNSEELRKEMEDLLGSVGDNPSSQGQNIANNPTFRELQNELAMLQQDLMVARDMADPMVSELQQALSASREDSQRLNEEFKRAMDDFGNIKDQVSNLEAENNRLRNVSLAQAQNNADQNMANMWTQMNGLEGKISSLSIELTEKNQRIKALRDQLAQAQSGTPGLSPDVAALRAQVIRLGGDVQDARDDEGRSKAEAQRLQQELAFAGEQIRELQESLRQAESAVRGLPSRMSSIAAPLSGSTSAVLTASQLAQLDTLRQQNVSLQNQLKTMSDIPGRNALDRRIRDLNQKNLTAQIQLDQERARVEDLRKQLDDARDIKRGVLERGQSATLKVDLLNDELTQARGKIRSLENALINAREAIRVLQTGGSGSNSIPVSFSGPSNVASNSFLSTSSPPQVRALPSRTPSPSFMGTPTGNRFSRISQPRGFSPLTSGRQNVASVQNIPSGDSSVQLKAEVQFLNNKRRPAGFTEFFLVEKSLDSIMQDSMVRIPRNEGIDSYAELWARAIQRGYRFPGVAASIRNSLARSSLTRLKTNSVGEANLDNLKSGSYYVVGASTLGQVGVVWSKPITLQNGENNVKLDLRDAAWAE